MRICLVLEGSYPYVYGGVSAWMHQVIQNMPEHEFVLWVIGARAEERGKFVYSLPGNVVEVQEVFLDDALRMREGGRMRHRFSEAEQQALGELIECGHPDWEVLFELYQRKRLNPVSYLKSEAFLEMLIRLCQEQYPRAAFADTFHTTRSMLLPTLYLLNSPAPRADCYHAICTGYGGLLAALGSYLYKKPLLLTEHGIYSREREEEIIRAKWVLPSFKKRWIRFFYMLSDAIYSRALRVTSLFASAMQIQAELGCGKEKCRVIPNGIPYERLAAIPLKKENGWIDIGALVRFAPIKDLKTMLYAFYELSARMPRVRLHILGGADDPEYAEECYDLARQLKLDRVIFAGRVDTVSYMEKLDFTLLTSISEGQPLSVLESLAAHRPCVATDVGSCRMLLMGDAAAGDTLGPAGYCVPPMNRSSLAEAMEKMCRSPHTRWEMGEAGQQRMKRYYRLETMMESYRALYREVETGHGGHRV